MTSVRHCTESRRVKLAIVPFQLVPDENLILNDLISKSLETNTRGKLVKINPFPLSSLFDNDLKEYFMHWSLDDDKNLETKSLWIISPKPVTVNDTQVRKIILFCTNDSVMNYTTNTHHILSDIFSNFTERWI